MCMDEIVTSTNSLTERLIIWQNTSLAFTKLSLRFFVVAKDDLSSAKMCVESFTRLYGDV
jgi:hypothetical protein